MTRQEYQAERREIRRQLRPALPSTVEQFKQPLRAGHCRDQVVQARAALARLNGTPLVSPQTPRQFEIAYRLHGLAIKRARREALERIPKPEAPEDRL